MKDDALDLAEGMACARPPQIEIAARSGLHFQRDPASYDFSRFIQEIAP